MLKWLRIGIASTTATDKKIRFRSLGSTKSPFPEAACSGGLCARPYNLGYGRPDRDSTECHWHVSDPIFLASVFSGLALPIKEVDHERNDKMLGVLVNIAVVR